MYLDTDVLLALLKAEDWLASAVDRGALETPITSTATPIEIQYVMQDEWERERLTRTHAAIADEDVNLVALDVETLDRAGDLRERYDRVGVFDSIHLGAAWARGESIVSTDTLYPAIAEVDHVDPRDL